MILVYVNNGGTEEVGEVGRMRLAEAGGQGGVVLPEPLDRLPRRLLADDERAAVWEGGAVSDPGMGGRRRASAAARPGADRRRARAAAPQPAAARGPDRRGRPGRVVTSVDRGFEGRRGARAS